MIDLGANLKIDIYKYCLFDIFLKLISNKDFM